MSLLKLLGDNGFISYNKDIARNIGVYEAIVLGELCSIADLFNYEEFYFSQSRIANDTGLSEKQIRSAIEKLASYGFVTITKKGQPCKNWYLLNETIIFDYLKQFDKKNQLGKNGSSSSAEMEQLDVPKMPNKIGKNGTTRCAKKEPLLYNNTSVTIQSNNTNNNTLSIGKAEKKKNETSDSQKRVNFLKSLQQNEYDFSKRCVERFIDFKKIIKKDFTYSQLIFNKWQYDFAVFALKNELNFDEFYKLLDFALSDTECSKWLFKPENFIKRYDEFQQRFYFANTSQNKTKKISQNNSLYKSFDKSSLDGKDFFAE